MNNTATFTQSEAADALTAKMIAAIKMFKRANLPTCALIEKFALANIKLSEIAQ